MTKITCSPHLQAQLSSIKLTVLPFWAIYCYFLFLVIEAIEKKYYICLIIIRIFNNELNIQVIKSSFILQKKNKKKQKKNNKKNLLLQYALMQSNDAWSLVL